MNLRLSSKQIQTFAVLFCMIVMNISLSARADNSPLLIKDLGEGHCLVRVNTNQKYLSHKRRAFPHRIPLHPAPVKRQTSAASAGGLPI